MAGRKRRRLGNHGFTLVEVMVAFMILMMVSGIFMSGVMTATRMKTRTLELERTVNGIGEHLLEKMDCEEGTVRLVFDDDFEISGEGFLYPGDGTMDVIWVEQEVVTNMEEFEEDADEEDL